MSTIAPAIQVGMKTFQRLLKTFSPNVSVCVRGRHAVGKSEGVYQSAEQIFSDFYKEPTNANKYAWLYSQGLPVIERRLSQLTEGDITGMPNLDEKRESTQFKPCDWLIDACNRPVLLFLDERNRALEGVKQAVFQLMDSRAFYGYKLHPETRVVVAENVGELYTVNQTDPAEVSRAATMELNPTVGEWLEYAGGRGNCHPMVVDFIRQNPNFLEFDPNAPENAKKVYESNKKYPDRRSWKKLDNELQLSGLIDRPGDEIFYAMVGSMVGVEAALKFTEFCKNYDRQVSAKDIVTDWAAAKRKLGIKEVLPSSQDEEANKAYEAKYQAKFTELSHALIALSKQTTFTVEQAHQFSNFMKDCPAEPFMNTWAGIQGNTKNVYRIHKEIEDLLVQRVTQGD